jgi:hypothetical protein
LQQQTLRGDLRASQPSGTEFGLADSQSLMTMNQMLYEPPQRRCENLSVTHDKCGQLFRLFDSQLQWIDQIQSVETLHLCTTYMFWEL